MQTYRNRCFILVWIDDRVNIVYGGICNHIEINVLYWIRLLTE